MENNISLQFTDYISVLAQQCLFQMGKIADPTTGKVYKDLRAAKLQIDIITMLEEKTKGNLNSEESSFLTNTLSSLRLTYVDEINRSENEENDDKKENEKKDENNTENKQDDKKEN